jgi:hypothetical protein
MSMKPADDKIIGLVVEAVDTAWHLLACRVAEMTSPKRGKLAKEIEATKALLVRNIRDVGEAVEQANAVEQAKE